MNSLKIISLWMALGGLAGIAQAQDAIVIDGQEVRVGPGQQVIVKDGKVTVSGQAAVAKDAQAAGKKESGTVIDGGTIILGGKAAASEESAWIGVITSPVSPALQSQLGLEEGTGLLVDFVAPDAPAKDVLKLHDIICQFNGQKVGDVDQFRTLVRAEKPGTEVSLLIRRQGKEQTVKVKLGVCPPEQTTMIQIMPDQMQDLGPRMGSIRLHPRSTTPQGDVKTLRHFSSNTAVMEADGEHTYSLRISGGDAEKATFTVVDKNGKTEFEGPVNTDEEKAKIPKEFQEKFGKLQESRKNIQIMRENFEMQPVPAPGLPVEHLRLIEEQRQEMERIQQQMEIQRQELKKIQEQLLKNAQPAGK